MAYFADDDDDDSKVGEEDKKYYRQYQPSYQNPYAPIHNLYNLPTSPEFLFDEEASIKHRSWGENLQYYTGSGYLSGAIIGAAKGSVQGLKAAEHGDTMKLRISRVLNSGGHTGRKFGNSLGVVGFIFSGLGILVDIPEGYMLESGIIHLRRTGDDDHHLLNTVAAGLGTGALYRAASGPRPAAVAAAIGGLAAAFAVVGKQVIKRYLPI